MDAMRRWDRVGRHGQKSPCQSVSEARRPKRISNTPSRHISGLVLLCTQQCPAMPGEEKGVSSMGHVAGSEKDPTPVTRKQNTKPSVQALYCGDWHGGGSFRGQ